MVETKPSITPNPSILIGNWLDNTDKLGSRIPVQKLTNADLPHPLVAIEETQDNHLINQQLGEFVERFILGNPKYFSSEQAQVVTEILSNEKHLKQSSFITSQKLKNKQVGHLMKGQSWQFGKVGLEVNPAAQQIAYKLHSLIELLEPYAEPGFDKNELLADEFTRIILKNKDAYGKIAEALGPSPFSVRWVDFLEETENPQQSAWIKDILQDVFPAERTIYDDILLSIAVSESTVTPGTIIQLLEKKTFRSKVKKDERGKPALDSDENPIPLRTENVTDSHRHANKVEFYLPLMGAGGLKVKFAGENNVQTFNPDPEVFADIDLSILGARMEKGVPTLIYDGREFIPEGHFINVRLRNGNIAKFIVIMPGDIHDYQNIGISPASAYALTLGFPKNPTVALTGDFESVSFS